MRFADSSAETSPGSLEIHGWAGSFNGGGSNRLFFGTNKTGLTSTQLAQIRFVDPTGLPQGTYRARILSTGEVIPLRDVPENAAVDQVMSLPTTASPRLLITALGEPAVVTWPFTNARTYRVIYKDSLSDSAWHPLDVQIVISADTARFEDTTGGRPKDSTALFKTDKRRHVQEGRIMGVT